MCCSEKFKESELNEIQITDSFPPGIRLYCNREECIEETKNWLDYVYRTSLIFILPSNFPKYLNIMRSNGEIENWMVLIGLTVSNVLSIRCTSGNYIKGCVYSELIGLNPELVEIDVLSNPIHKSLLSPTIYNYMENLKNVEFDKYKKMVDAVEKWKKYSNYRKIYIKHLNDLVCLYWYHPNGKGSVFQKSAFYL